MPTFTSLPVSLQEEILGQIVERLDEPRKADFLLLSRRYLPFLRRILYRSISFRVGPEAYRAQKFARTLSTDPAFGSFVENFELVEAHLGALSYSSPGASLVQTIFWYIRPRVLKFEAYTIPIWAFTTLQADNLKELHIDFNCDRWLWRPPEDKHLLSQELDKDGAPWFLQKPLHLEKLIIHRPPLNPTASMLVDLAMRMTGTGLQELAIHSSLDRIWIPTLLNNAHLFSNLRSLTIALQDIRAQIPIGQFPTLETLYLSSIAESEIAQLPRFIRDTTWLPRLTTLQAHYDELILMRFLKDDMRSVHVACRDRALKYYIHHGV